MKRLKHLFISTIALAGLASCNGAPQQAQAPTATLAPIVSMTPRFTATPVSSPTPLPTFTLTPSETPIPPTPSNTPTPTEIPPQRGAVQSSQRVNIREGPGTSFDTVYVLEPGTRVVVLSQSSDGLWYNIEAEDGTAGWISSRLLRLQDTPVPASTATPTPNLTAMALGTPLPTAIFGGGTVTPTPPLSAVTPTPVAGVNTSAEAGASVINVDAFNQTATALINGITGAATGTAQSSGVTVQNSTATGPIGGPTGGPPGVAATATFVPGQATALAAQRPDVPAYCDDRSYAVSAPSNLRDGVSVDIYWGWNARTEELVQQHVDNVIYSIAVDGQELQNWRQYATPIRLITGGRYYQAWYVPYGPLTAGRHVVTYHVTWETAISDGFDEFGPGTGIPEQSATCTFTVQ